MLHKTLNTPCYHPLQRPLILRGRTGGVFPGNVRVLHIVASVCDSWQNDCTPL